MGCDHPNPPLMGFVTDKGHWIPSPIAAASTNSYEHFKGGQQAPCQSYVPPPGVHSLGPYAPEFLGDWRMQVHKGP